jgi:hypothetical protein
MIRAKDNVEKSEKNIDLVKKWYDFRGVPRKRFPMTSFT